MFSEMGNKRQPYLKHRLLEKMTEALSDNQVQVRMEKKKQNDTSDKLSIR